MNTKREAVAKARAIVRGHGGGEVRVMNKAGKIVEADTVRKRGSKSRSGTKNLVLT
jgi:hypothetical protein